MNLTYLSDESRRTTIVSARLPLFTTITTAALLLCALRTTATAIEYPLTSAAAKTAMTSGASRGQTAVLTTHAMRRRQTEKHGLGLRRGAKRLRHIWASHSPPQKQRKATLPYLQNSCVQSVKIRLSSFPFVSSVPSQMSMLAPSE